MTGNELVPLNKLKHTNLPLYAHYAAKYQGREEVMDKHIPPLGCMWNDVVFMTAVHPQKLMDARKSLRSRLHRNKFFQIDPYSLDPSLMTVWLSNSDNDTSPASFEPFVVEDIGKYSEVPPATVEYYRRCVELRRRILIFALVPHILYRGTIDVSNAKIIEVT